MKFVIPGAEDRTTFVGGTGTGKTIAGAWLLSKQNFENRPWVAIDYKDEVLWDRVGDPPMRPLRVGEMPGKKGLYRLHVNPWEEDAMEDWLRRVWEKGNIGLFCDEVSLMPKGGAFKAILRQGRSLRIPCIMCTQRPVDCDREVFSESQYKAIFALEDDRDYKVIKGFFRSEFNIEAPLPRHHFYWYDGKQRVLMKLSPVPKPDIIAKSLRESVPYSWFLGG